MKKEMFYNEVPTISRRSKDPGHQLTDAEQVLWMHLRTKPKGYKFHRQHPATNYILDFYCQALKMAIEVDRSIHNEEEIVHNDIERQKNVEAQGVKFIRFDNKEIMMNFEEVIEKIDAVIDECHEKMTGSDFNFYERDDNE